MYVKQNDTYKEVDKIFIKQNGAYQQVDKLYIKQNEIYVEVELNGTNYYYSPNEIDALIPAGNIANIPIKVYGITTETLQWYSTITTGNFSLINDTTDEVSIITDNQTSTGIVWVEIDGVSLGGIPITIKYSGGL